MVTEQRKSLEEKFKNTLFLTQVEPPIHTNCLEHPQPHPCFPGSSSVDLGPREGSEIDRLTVGRKKLGEGGRVLR